MKKEWFIKLDEVEQGPFTINELKRNPFITPETLVWKKGFKAWIPIGSVKELKEVFKDEKEPDEEKESEDESSEKYKKAGGWSHDQITLAAQSDPGNFIIWLIIILLILTWIFYRIN
jgi:hypothetical protein